MAPPTDAVRTLTLASLSQRLSLRRLQQTLAEAKYTGGVTVHFRGGKPIKIELGRPIQLDVTDDEDLTAPINLVQTPTTHG